jgi:hypothetical protein
MLGVDVAFLFAQVMSPVFGWLLNCQCLFPIVAFNAACCCWLAAQHFPNILIWALVLVHVDHDVHCVRLLECVVFYIFACFDMRLSLTAAVGIYDYDDAGQPQCLHHVQVLHTRPWCMPLLGPVLLLEFFPADGSHGYCHCCLVNLAALGWWCD